MANMLFRAPHKFVKSEQINYDFSLGPHQVLTRPQVSEAVCRGDCAIFSVALWETIPPRKKPLRRLQTQSLPPNLELMKIL